MVETIVNMHAHDKFHNSNKDLIGLMWSTTMKTDRPDREDDEVIMADTERRSSTFSKLLNQ